MKRARDVEPVERWEARSQARQHARDGSEMQNLEMARREKWRMLKEQRTSARIVPPAASPRAAAASPRAATASLQLPARLEVPPSPRASVRLNALLESLKEATQAGATLAMCGALQEMSTLPASCITKARIQESGAGRVVGKLRRHGDADVAEMATTIVTNWKRIISETPAESPLTSPLTPSPRSVAKRWECATTSSSQYASDPSLEGWFRLDTSPHAKGISASSALRTEPTEESDHEGEAGAAARADGSAAADDEAAAASHAAGGSGDAAAASASKKTADSAPRPIPRAASASWRTKPSSNSAVASAVGSGPMPSPAPSVYSSAAAIAPSTATYCYSYSCSTATVPSAASMPSAPTMAPAATEPSAATSTSEAAVSATAANQTPVVATDGVAKAGGAAAKAGSVAAIASTCSSAALHLGAELLARMDSDVTTNDGTRDGTRDGSHEGVAEERADDEGSADGEGSAGPTAEVAAKSGGAGVAEVMAAEELSGAPGWSAQADRARSLSELVASLGARKRARWKPALGSLVFGAPLCRGKPSLGDHAIAAVTGVPTALSGDDYVLRALWRDPLDGSPVQVSLSMAADLWPPS